MAHNEKTITVIFIYNDQFIIDDGIGPVIYTDVIQEPDASDPEADIILITHEHGDHFDPIVVEQIATSSGATVVGPNPVIDALEGSVPPEQLVRMDPPVYERMNQTIQGTEIRAYHGSSDNNSYRFRVGNGVVSIYHSGDNLESDFDQYISNGYTELYNLNIAMLAGWSFDLENFNTTYHPDVMIKMHEVSMWDRCEVYENYPEYITLYSEDSWQYQHIPTIDIRSGTIPSIDGIISPGEWDDANSIMFFNDQGEINMYFKHNDTTLYFMSYIIDSTYYWGDDIVIGIDTEHNGELHPQPDDYQFYIRRDVNTSEINRGSGSGWEPVPEEEWAGLVWNETSSDATTWTAELSISYTFLNLTAGDQIVGIQFRSYDDNPQGWYNWPEDSDETWPDSWADMSSSDNWGIEDVTKTLYVGGSGSGNYTHIQWAIENASDGDTVFVYDDSAPYYENVVVNKTINLIGEDRNSTVVNAGMSGNVIFVNANFVNISGFTITNSGGYSGDAGIELNNTLNCCIMNNNIPNNEIGISLKYSHSNIITHNTASLNRYTGISLYNSSNNIVRDNNCSSNNAYGVFLWTSSHNNQIRDNNISLNRDYGVNLSFSNMNTITYNNIYDNWRGIGLSYESNNNTIARNVVFNNTQYGIDISYSDWNNITNNNVSNNWHGILLRDSNSNNISNNFMTSNNRYGIYIVSSNSNHIINNDVLNHSICGIYIKDSSTNHLTGNTIYKGGMFITGDLLEQWNTHIIDTSNTVNNMPIHYLKNQIGGTVPLGAGQVILANCTDVRIENQELNNSYAGISLGFSSKINVTDNNISSNWYYGIYFKSSNLSYIVNNIITSNNNGIYLEFSMMNNITKNSIFLNTRVGGRGIFLYYSQNNTIISNNVSNNYWGIDFEWSSYNNIIGNNISANIASGIYFYKSSNNNITKNNVSHNNQGFCIVSSMNNDLVNNSIFHNDCEGIELILSNNNNVTCNILLSNDYGIYIDSSSDNAIYHNDFLNNANQATDNDANQWDNGYPSGGNYWSDWTTPDDNSGPGQDEPGGDGIVDNPKAIDGGANQDYYPYTTENGWLNPPEFGPVHNIDTDEYFDTIQEAIDDPGTFNGHTIEVSAGTYNENVDVNKTINLIGEDKNTTIIDGGGSGDVVTIEADFVNLTGFTITNSGGNFWDYGIQLNSNYSDIRDCIVTNNEYGIHLDSSRGNNITGNIVLSNIHDGISIMYSSENNNISDNIISNNFFGVHILGSGGNTIVDNTVTSNSDGILVYSSIGNKLIGNNVSSNSRHGIFLNGDVGTNVRDNEIMFNHFALDDSGVGIFLSSSTGSTITGNAMVEDGFIIEGNQLEYWNTHEIDISNTVNGKPVYYWKNQTGGNVPPGAGQVLLANCSNVKIESLEFTYVSAGIILGFSSNNIIVDNIISNNWLGMYLEYSIDNSIYNNHISSNEWQGIYLVSSSNNTIKNNNATTNEWYGIYLWGSNDNTIIENNITLNDEYGIFIGSSSDNRIYHNNFTDNANQAYDDRNDNYWDNGYPSGGNYWSDWTTPDDYSGPDQDEPGSDGIVDDARAIDGGLNQDNYPYTTESGWLSQPPPGPVHNIDTDEYFDLIQEAIDDPDTLNGHTIEVSPGTYYENVVVDKTITLIGEDKDTTIIDGGGNEDVVLITADWVNLTEFSISGSGSNEEDAGIELNNVQNCNVNNNNILNNSEGIYINHSNKNIITNNNISYNSVGIYINSSVGNSIMDNFMLGNGIFIFGESIEYWNSHDIRTSNTVNGKSIQYWKNRTAGTIPAYAGQVILANCSNVLIKNQEISNSSVGIELGFSSNNDMRDNTISNNIYGLFMVSSNGNTITDNNFASNGFNLFLIDSIENFFTDNYISDSGIGVLALISGGNTIEENSIFNNGIGIWFLGSEMNNFSDNNISHNEIGIDLWSCSWNNITGNIISNNGHGITLFINCSWNNISGNIISNNGNGTELLINCSWNNISDNNISNNGNGIILNLDSNWNNINYNTISNNEDGIILSGMFTVHPINNQIYHNSIIDNTNQASDSTNNGNQWDNGYPSGGNYWSDSDEPSEGAYDDYQGPDQDVPGSDGIVDNGTIAGGGKNPYSIDPDSRDNYPLIDPWGQDNSPPSLKLFTPSNNSVIKPGTMINLSISDLNLDQVTYSLNGGPEQPSSIPYEIDTTDWPDGNYIVEIHATDTYNNANTKWFNFTIDSISPSITLNSPNNNSMIKTGIMINLSISDANLDEVLYSINNGPDEALSQPYDIDPSTWDDGSYIIALNASDFAGNFNEVWFNFTIDSTPPEITLNSPQNNSVIKTDLEIDLTISDTNLDKVTYSKNGGTAMPLSPPYNIDTGSWPDGEYNITIYAEDLAGNFNEKWFAYTKDTALPEIILNSPENNSLLMQALTLDFDVSDENLNSASYSVNQGTFKTFEAPYDLDTTNWEDGNYVIKIRAEDTAGNMNERWFIFMIDTLPPSILSTSPDEGVADVDVETEIVIEFSEHMDTASVESAISTEPFIEYSCLWSNDNKTLTINFSEPLAYDTLYIVTISTKAEDMAGRELESRYEFEFTTEEKKEEEEGFPIFNLLLPLLLAIVVAVIIVVLVLAKKKTAAKEMIPAQPQIEGPEAIQVTCSICGNLLRVEDIGTTMNVTCPFCASLLTVESRKAAAQMPFPQPYGQTILISCPQCSYAFQFTDKGGPMRVQCPNCGITGRVDLGGALPGPIYTPPLSKAPAKPSQHIKCPACENLFVVETTARPISIQCPHCGVSGSLR